MCSNDFCKSVGAFTLAYTPFMAVLFSYGWLIELIVTSDGTHTQTAFRLWALTLGYTAAMALVWCLIACLWHDRPMPVKKPVTTIYLNEDLVMKALVTGYWSGYLYLFIAGAAVFVSTSAFLIFNMFSHIVSIPAAIALTVTIMTYPGAVWTQYRVPEITYMDIEAQE